MTISASNEIEKASYQSFYYQQLYVSITVLLRIDWTQILAYKINCSRLVVTFLNYLKQNSQRVRVHESIFPDRDPFGCA
jgi:hypothetical protein